MKHAVLGIGGVGGLVPFTRKIRAGDLFSS
jgi:hypothetical protein